MNFRFPPIHLIAWIGFLLTSACVSEIEFDVEKEGIPIVSGVLSNSEQERLVYVSETVEIEERSKPISATGRIFRDSLEVGILTEVQKGVLGLPADLLFEGGHTYHLEIRTSNQRVFQTRPQTILSGEETKALSWRKRRELTGVNLEGIPIEKLFVEILAEIEVLENQEEKYYRWQGEDVWIHKEIPKPYADTTLEIECRFQLGGIEVCDTTKVFIPDTVKTCYPFRDVSYYPSTLLRTGELKAGMIQTPVLSREVDQSFLFRHYFSIYLRRIDKDAYTFYEKSERLIAAAGTLYDEIPAPVVGNVFDFEDPDKMVLGYVEMALADTIRLAISKEELHMVLRDDCRPNDGGPEPCRWFPVTPPPACKCWDCDLIYGLQTDNKPDWWE